MRGMDDRIYFHQYRKPRFSNPTFLSNNVNHSLTFFENNSSYKNSFYSKKNDIDTHNNSYSLNKPNDVVRTEKYQNIPQSNQPPQFSQPLRGVSNPGRHSNLSAYGTTSLSLNQNDIFNKQNSKFNIITMQPKQYDMSIRQNPKYTLENKDQLYYKRMAEELQKKRIYEEAWEKKHQSNLRNEELIAGKHTYGSDKEKVGGKVHLPVQYKAAGPESVNPQYNQQYNELANLQQQKHKAPKQFTPKLLSQMDELLSLS